MFLRFALYTLAAAITLWSVLVTVYALFAAFGFVTTVATIAAPVIAWWVVDEATYLHTQKTGG